jgi:phosphotransferase system enzyme I (PtsP)
MIEVPALLWQLDQLLPAADFASIGSNDLAQFLFASDRGHPRLADRYDLLSSPVLGAIREIVVAAEAHKVPVNLCGEMAGRPLEAMALIGLGLTSVSMAPAAIGPVKAMILSLDRAKLWSFMEPLLESGEASIRAELKTFADQNRVMV